MSLWRRYRSPSSGHRASAILEVDADGRVCGFEEKPEHPRPMPGNPRQAYASMGNYVFSAACLVRALREAHRLGETDFGNHVLPRLLHSRRMFAYDFTRNRIPGLNAYEEPAYWRDVGTIDAYFEAHQDTLGGEPRFDLFVGAAVKVAQNSRRRSGPLGSAGVGVGVEQETGSAGRWGDRRRSRVSGDECANQVSSVVAHAIAASPR